MASVSRRHLQELERVAQANARLTNARPSAIYKVTPPTNQAQGPAQVGIEIAPLAAVDALVQQRAASREKGAEIAAKVDVGKVAEKVVKNVRIFCSLFVSALSLFKGQRQGRGRTVRESARPTSLRSALTTSCGTTSTHSATRR